METDVRNRKNKKSSAISPKNKKNAGGNRNKDELEGSLEKLKELNRDSGDGDSAPSTPPPEFNYDKTELISSEQVDKKKVASSKNVSKEQSGKVSSRSSYIPLTFQLDGMAIAIFILAFATRVWKLDTPRGIVFDELHYGKYAGMYMQNTFFFDSQPPLGKQLIAVAAYISGFDGSFKFERIGSPYNATVPVAAMRMVPAFFGSLLMPTIYNLLTEVGMSQNAGILAAFLMIFDNAVLGQSRFILMESMLLFFGVFGLLCILKMRRFYHQPYSVPWFLYLILGISSLSAAFCVRYFGIFSFFLGIGILTKDFWTIVGDRAVSDLQLFFHCIVRTVFVVAIPVGLYISVFYVHLNLLYKAGPNDNIMTSAFQASLEGGLASIIANQPVKIVHGSQITLRHTHGKTCWLHSHDDVYPVKYADDRGSSHQQQVTCYSYKDVNNWWIVKKPDNDELIVREPHEPIKDGDIIQLVHGLTSRTLNSHDVASAMSPYSQEIACYIDYNVSMPVQNLWKVEVINKDLTEGFWHAVESEIRLIHVNTSTVMRFSGRQLPDWGFRQHEMVADKIFDHDDAVWNVEEHRYSRTEDQKEREKELIKQEMIPTERRNLSFFDKLYELQYKMIFNNQENVAGHMYASDPLDWLTLKRGVAYWISGGSNAQIHYIGNVVVWISGTLSLIGYALLFIIYLLRRQRACYDLPLAEWNKFCNAGQVFMCGYLINYLPYFTVDRTLFLHHYLPAYIFKLCILASLVDHGYYISSKLLKSRVLSAVYLLVICVWMMCIVYVFLLFAPFTYGHVGLTGEEIESLTWRNTWDFIVVKQ